MIESQSEFDFVIVGAGSAGSVLAWELAEKTDSQVLVIESGSRASHRNSRIPALYPHLFRDKRFCGDFLTVPQPGLANRRIFLPAGRGLGGSSLVNAMIWIPPALSDLTRWTKTNAGAWSIDEMQGAVRELEDVYFQCEGMQDQQHYVSPTTQSFVDRSIQSGSVSILPFRRSIRRGKRITTWQAFSGTSATKSPLVLRDTHVSSIAIEDGRAIGVLVSDRPAVEGILERGANATIRARKGVVLCAGAIQTPTLLLRSGVGPRDVLQAADVPIIREAEQVGKNLQDHLIFPLIYRWNRETLPSRFTRDEHIEWHRGRQNWLASNIAEAGGFWNEGRKTSVQWHVTPTHYVEYPMRDTSTPAISIGVTPLHPVSRGEVLFDRSGNSVVDPRYQSMMEDREQMIEAVKTVRSVIADWQKDIPIGEEIIPGNRRQSDEQIASAIARYATTLFHYVGTCAGGSGNENVCDSNFRVRGIEKLYVCDASSLPDLPAGNTQVSVMMIAKMLVKRLCDAKF